MSPKPQRQRLVKVATAANEAVAQMLRQLLEQHGIGCVVKAAGAGPGLFSPAGLPHYLYVLAPDATRAEEIVTFYLDSDASIGLEKSDNAHRDMPGPLQ
ncbi:MAG TPA: DUF2007 domain-containing protein [Dehalococcoidia bacterium]|nr:DUF2007 domain-containing protein [Dehalococcoidia bacterium]